MNASLPAPPLAPSPGRHWASWISGILGLAALILFVLGWGELQQFLALAQRAEPQWLIAAALLQIFTYICAAAVWRLVLREAGVRQSLFRLVPLSVAKLFTDQAIPSGGVSGTLLLVRGLIRRGVPSSIAMGAMLVALVSYYAAFLLAVLLSLVILWEHHAIDAWIAGVAAAFAAVAVAIPAIALWLRHRSDRPLPAVLERVPAVAWLFRALAGAPPDLVRKPILVVQTTALQGMIFVLDTATLWVMLRAIGQEVSPAAVFASFIMASVVAAIGPVPLGLGTFEATAVVMLRLFGVPLEAALTATLLLRGFTSWLPMLPGLWLARRETRVEP